MIMKTISTKRRARLAVPLTMLLATAFAACGDNLFQPPGSGEGAKPEITGFTITPTTVSEGGTLDMQVEGQGSRALSQISIDFSGALNRDTVIAIADNVREIDRQVVFTVPFNTGPTGNLDLTVTLIDAAGETAAVDTSVTVTDATAPVVSSWQAGPTAVGSGEEILIDIAASDNRGLANVGVRVTSPTGYDTTLTETLATPATSHSTTFVLEAPDLVITTLEVSVFATDITGIEQAGTGTRELALTDKTVPGVSSFLVQGSATPITVALRDSLRVEARVTDRTGVKRVTFYGETVVGDPDLFEDSLVLRYGHQTVTFPRPLQDTLPKDTTVVTRIWSDDVTTKGPTIIYAEVEDSVGNIARATFDITVGGPLVQITSPSESQSPVAAPLNEPQSFTIRIFDAAGIDSAFLSLTGALESRVTLALPGTTTDTFTVTQLVTMPTAGGTVFAQAKAWSGDDVLGISGIRQVQVQDLRGPSLDAIRVNDSGTEGITLPLGDSVKVEADISDPSGITVVTFKGLALVGDSVLFEDSVVTRFDESSVTFPRAFEDTLPKTTTVRRRLGSSDVTTRGDVRIVVTARDSLGNESEGEFDITVGGPSVVLTDPAPGAGTIVSPLAEPVDVTVRFYDPAGIDSARLELTGAIDSIIPLTLPAITTDTFTITQSIATPSVAGSFTGVA